MYVCMCVCVREARIRDARETELVWFDNYSRGVDFDLTSMHPGSLADLYKSLIRLL